MKLVTYRIFAILSLIALIISACEKDVGTIEELDSQNIQAYIKKNNLDVQQYNNTGIFYKIISPATGEALANNKEIALVFTINSVDGAYSSVDTVFATRFANFAGYMTPEGFKTAVFEILKKGNGQMRLLIPSRLAYGRNGNASVPGNASLDVWVRTIDVASIPKYDDGVIQQFLTKNALTGYTKSPKGVWYKISAPGTGTAVITDQSKLTLKYTGKLLDGRLFDSSTESTFYLEDLIAGWREVVPLLKEGGTVRLAVPSAMGYGFKGSGTIPPFACLDFEITVSKVTN